MWCFSVEQGNAFLFWSAIVWQAFSLCLTTVFFILFFCYIEYVSPPHKFHLRCCWLDEKWPVQLFHSCISKSVINPMVSWGKPWTRTLMNCLDLTWHGRIFLSCYPSSLQLECNNKPKFTCNVNINTKNVPIPTSSTYYNRLVILPVQI